MIPDHAPESLCISCLLDTGQDEEPAVKPTDLTADLAEGTRFFGDYELLREAGRGGMGVVYEARQFGTQRGVALKLLSSGPFASADNVHRFHTEAAAAARLEHPHIVPVYEAGMHEGQYFLAMRFLSGGTLADQLRQGPLPDCQAAELLLAITDAVRHAHQHGVLHRDLKPGNILLDSEGRPGVADFGLARLTDDDSSLTLSHAMLGTVAYLAPEVAGGGAAQATTAADIYGLGAVLYEMLTGRTPFREANLAETVRAVQEQDPVPVNQLNPAASRDLATICHKCLEKDPARRYADAEDLTNDLQHFLNDEPIQARPVSRTERCTRWCRRKPALAASLAATALLLLTLIIGSPIVAFRINEARHAALEQARLARLNQYVADINLASRALRERQLAQARQLLGAHAEPGDQEDFRGWEWDYLWDQARSDASFQLGEHPDRIRCATFSPTGKQLVSADLGGTIKLWDFDTRTLIRTHKEPRTVHSLAFLSETVFASANHAGTITFYDSTDGRVILSLALGASVRALAVSSDLRKLAALTGFDGGERLKLWDVAVSDSKADGLKLTPTLDLPGPDRHVSWIAMGALDFSPDGSRLAVGYSDSSIRIYNVSDGKIVRVLTGSGGSIATLDFSLDGKWLASGSIGADKTVRIWDVESGQLHMALSGQNGWISRVAFVEGDTRLISTSADQTVGLWDTATWQLEHTLQGHLGEIKALATSPSHKEFVTGAIDGVLLGWTLADSYPSRAPLALPNLMNFAFAPIDGSLVTVERTSDNPARSVALVRNGPDYTVDRELTALGDGLRDVSFSSDGKLLAALAGQGLRLCDWQNQTLEMSQDIPNANAWSLLGFTRDDSEVLLVDWNLAVVSWDVRRNQLGERWSALGPHLSPSYFSDCYTAFHPNSGTLALGIDEIALVWDVPTKTLRRSLAGHGFVPVYPSISPDGTMIATSGRTNFLWDARTFEWIGGLIAPSGGVQAMSFSGDGRRLVCGIGGAPALGVFDVETRRELLLLPGDVGLVHRIAWSPDGRALVARGKQGFIWKAPARADFTERPRAETAAAH